MAYMGGAGHTTVYREMSVVCSPWLELILQTCCSESAVGIWHSLIFCIPTMQVTDYWQSVRTEAEYHKHITQTLQKLRQEIDSIQTCRHIKTCHCPGHLLQNRNQDINQSDQYNPILPHQTWPDILLLISYWLTRARFCKFLNRFSKIFR